jgi:hypothetical protein
MGRHGARLRPDGPSDATRAYAWSSPIEGSTKPRFFAVLLSIEDEGATGPPRYRPYLLSNIGFKADFPKPWRA